MKKVSCVVVVKFRDYSYSVEIEPPITADKLREKVPMLTDCELWWESHPYHSEDVQLTSQEIDWYDGITFRCQPIATSN